jgi:hypothetical protein
LLKLIQEYYRVKDGGNPDDSREHIEEKKCDDECEHDGE